MATTKITTKRGRNVTVHTFAVGQRFGTAAAAQIGGRAFESRVVPYGFDAAAIEDITAKIEAWEAAR